MRPFLIVCLVGFCLLVALPSEAFDLQGHRGARGLLPENTLPAFARALTIGVTNLELDVGVSRRRHHRGRPRSGTQSGPCPRPGTANGSFHGDRRCGP